MPYCQARPELSVKHDIQRFLVDHFVEWSINTNGEVDVLVKWQGHEDDEGEHIWETLEHGTTRRGRPRTHRQICGQRWSPLARRGSQEMCTRGETQKTASANITQ